MQTAAPSVKHGVDGIARIFGLAGQQEGAIPTEGDHARQQQGIRRFASGEGAATPQEIQEIDQTIGMENVQADAGMKNLMRIDKVVQFYLMRGDKDSAEAASASLLQHGAVQVRQAATMASAAFEHWQETGDPNDLKRASQFVERAHQYIPDGMNMKLDVDPRTRQLVATVTGADGQAQQHVVDPQQVPQLLQTAMDGSAYWKSVYQIGQPRLAEQGMVNEAAGQRAADTRQYEGYKNEREAQEEQYRHERDISDGKGTSAGERATAAQQQWLGDWQERYKTAGTPEEKQALTQEALQYRYDSTPDRKTGIDSTLLGFAEESPFANTFDEPDTQTLRTIAQVIARKNSALDAPAAMELAASLVTSPEFKNNGDGTVDANGFSIVFNPQLLPQVSQLRKKYRPQ